MNESFFRTETSTTHVPMNVSVTIVVVFFFYVKKQLNSNCRRTFCTDERVTIFHRQAPDPYPHTWGAAVVSPQAPKFFPGSLTTGVPIVQHPSINPPPPRGTPDRTYESTQLILLAKTLFVLQLEFQQVSIKECALLLCIFLSPLRRCVVLNF